MFRWLTHTDRDVSARWAWKRINLEGCVGDTARGAMAGRVNALSTVHNRLGVNFLPTHPQSSLTAPAATPTVLLTAVQVWRVFDASYPNHDRQFVADLSPGR